MDRSLAFKKGSDFEISVYLTLKRQLKNTLVMHDVHIPADPNPAQIDILVVRGWSFYILELKNYESSLTGILKDKKWVAKSDKHTYNVQNPLQQNNNQALKLMRALNDKGFTLPQVKNCYIIVPATCRLNIDVHLKNAVMTLDSFINLIKKSEPGEGDINKLREVLLEWKK